MLTIKEAGMLGATDTDHIALAKKEGRVIFTQDVDFLRLHAKGTEHCGIVYAQQQTPIGEIIRCLTLLHQILDYNDMQNHIEFL
ncbi:hypothetical protein SCALIN_C19_0003 [Candidatus Scalindua japonica]|uniref:DUF5615 domain-containing protein n=1 Tax=Candidatus Scalindua japonica TaxID=1284222 RepID=A0A286TZ66_9BACT|nr:hypothetical protein SCALIN_C19_0003 [Candidatus Scalindua japonica]